MNRHKKCAECGEYGKTLSLMPDGRYKCLDCLGF